MNYRVLTIAREFGSGGGLVAKIVAGRLGWTLLDAALIERVALEAHVDPKVARNCDERVDSWFHRLNKSGIVASVMSAGVPLTPTDVFDAETMSAFSANCINKAYAVGNCVIVGRGAQCVLHDRPGVFHVFVYASDEHRVKHLRPRYPETANLADAMVAVDQERARYIRRYFGETWDDRHLYNLMVSCDAGEDRVARVVLAAMGDTGGSK